MPDLTVLEDFMGFQAELPPEESGAMIRVRLVLRPVLERDARVVAGRSFTALVKAPSRDAATIVIAFVRATTRLISEIAP